MFLTQLADFVSINSLNLIHLSEKRGKNNVNWVIPGQINQFLILLIFFLKIDKDK